MGNYCHLVANETVVCLYSLSGIVILVVGQVATMNLPGHDVKMNLKKMFVSVKVGQVRLCSLKTKSMFISQQSGLFVKQRHTARWR